MIKYKSTRGYKKIFTFSEAILKGIAPDGGLFVPERIPQFSLIDLKNLQSKSYDQVANFVINLFEPDFSKKEIARMTKKAYAYGENFDDKEIAPIVHLKENQYILELWHGSTWAFKDMALQLMPLLFSYAIKKDNKKRVSRKEKPLQYLILVATSGDTGKAALEGYKSKDDISIIVLFPDKKISSIQELSMTTQEGNNLAVYPLLGNFDDTQRIVKEIFDDKKFNKKLFNDFQTTLSSGNSINWGRFLPQVIYHISSYVNLISQNVIKIGDEIDIVVPTGNFGNILAGFIAKKMGLPIRKLVCASNDNNVLSEFIQTGNYDLTKRKLVVTSSPSIDILVASNLERLLYLITNNSNKIKLWMRQLKSKKKFFVDDNTKKVLQKEFYADWVSDKDSLENIKNIFEQCDRLIDPHTSIAQKVAQEYINNYNVKLPIIIHSTAHFAKFASAVYSSLFRNNPEKLSEFEMLKAIKKLSKKIKIPRNIEDLKSKKIIHKGILNSNKKDAERAIISILN